MVVEVGTDGLNIGITIPPQADGFGAFGLLETTKVQLEVFIVEIDRGNSWVQ